MQTCKPTRPAQPGWLQTDASIYLSVYLSIYVLNWRSCVTVIDLTFEVRRQADRPDKVRASRGLLTPRRSARLVNHS
jgi:hypothetical protein